MAEVEQITPSAFGRITKLQTPYEIFGTGPIRLLFLPGMALSRRSWVNQVIHFSKPEFSVLVIENRGNGEVEHANVKGINSTTSMARDVKRALDTLNWTEKKSVHLIGLSMGGMISLQLCQLIPDRIASLCLTSTCSQWLPPLPGMKSSAASLGMVTATTEEQRIRNTIYMCFPPAHLSASDPDHPDYKTNFDRYVADGHNLISKEQTKGHFFGQIAAVTRHHVSASSLRKIGQGIGFAYVVVGDADKLINPKCSKVLSSMIGCKLRVYPGHGHLIPWESPAEYNKDLEALVRQADKYWKEHPDETIRGSPST